MAWKLAIILLAGFSLYVEGCPTAGVRRTLDAEFQGEDIALNELDLFVKSCDAFRDIVGNIGGALEEIVNWYKRIYEIPPCRQAAECWIGEVLKLPIDWTTRKELVSCIQNRNVGMDDGSRRTNTEWTPWSSCSKTCGNGTMTRTCHSMPSRVQLRSIECGLLYSRKCSVGPCPIKSGRINTQWSTWSACSETCGSGIMTRTCHSRPTLLQLPSVRCGVQFSRRCFVSPCSGKSVNGDWGPWKKSGVCSKSCGAGLQIWRRSCLANDRPVSFSRCKGFAGASQFRMQCNTQSCSHNIWSAWRDEGSCTSSCGSVGIQRQSRSCWSQSGLPVGTCPGMSTRTRRCHATSCLIGNWGPWKKIGGCSKSCSVGSQTWSRSCLVSGKPVSFSWCKGIAGSGTIYKQCNTQPCPEYHTDLILRAPGQATRRGYYHVFNFK